MDIFSALLNHSHVFFSIMVKYSSQSWSCFLLNHGRFSSQSWSSILLNHGHVFFSIMAGFLLNHGQVFFSIMARFSSQSWPGFLLNHGRFSSQSWSCFLLNHGRFSSQSWQVFFSIMVMFSSQSWPGFLLNHGRFSSQSWPGFLLNHGQDCVMLRAESLQYFLLVFFLRNSADSYLYIALYNRNNSSKMIIWPISRHVCYSLDTIFKDISSIITILRVFLETFLAGNKLTNVTFTKRLVGCV